MRSALIIAAHLLRRLVRRPGLVLLLVAVPVTLVLIEYAAFGGGVASGKLPPVKVLLLDEDGSLASRAVPQFFANDAVSGMFQTANVSDRAAAREAFQRNEAAALVVVPRGFQQALLEGRRAEIVLYKNPLQAIGPDMTQGVLEMGATIGNRLYLEAAAPLARIRALDQSGREATADDIADISRGFFEAGRGLTRLSLLGNGSVEVQRPNQPAGTQAGFPTGARFFALFYPGLVIFAMMCLSQSLAVTLLRDRVRGLERRIAMAPVSWIALASGGALYLAVALAAVMAVLALVGVGLFGIALREPLALVTIASGFAVFAGALQLTVATVARTDRGAGFMGTALVIMLTLVSGGFVPAEAYPAWLRVVAFGLPNGAAQQAFIDVLAHGRGLPAVSSLVATTWAWAILTLGAYVYFKRRSMAVQGHAIHL